ADRVYMAAKSKKILIVESNAPLVDLIKDPLEQDGYSVIVTLDGKEGLNLARREQPSLVILDFKLPNAKGNEIAKTLRRDPVTSHERILMLADENQLEHLEIGPKSAVDDFLIKPFSVVELISKVKPLLISPEDENAKLISTGNPDLDNKMGGGVPMGSLTLIEGDSGAGKSVLAQQVMHGGLTEGHKLAFFTSENTVKSMVKQMRSLNLDVLDYLLLDYLRIYPIETSRLGKDAPAMLVHAMKREKE